MATLNIIIQGKVQGVFYRKSAKTKALQTGLTGWVKNTPEGHVEVIAQGSDKMLENFIEWCKQGPPNARVDKVIVKEAGEQHYDEFKILH